MNDDILETAMKVRKQVLEVAKERNSNNSNGNGNVIIQSKWIPTMSQLSGKLLDIIAVQVLCIVEKFNSQELANLLYAFSSAGRADVYFFDQLADQLVKNMNLGRGGSAATQPKLQEYR